MPYLYLNLNLYLPVIIDLSLNYVVIIILSIYLSFVVNFKRLKIVLGYYGEEFLPLLGKNPINYGFPPVWILDYKDILKDIKLKLQFRNRAEKGRF